jgi:hypothetical protein
VVLFDILHMYVCSMYCKYISDNIADVGAPIAKPFLFIKFVIELEIILFQYYVG